jgi:hypothetical protein
MTLIGLSWLWIALMATVPPLAGVAAAYPFWQREETIFGNIVGSVLIFAASMGCIFREYQIIDRVTQQCLDAGYTCWPDPPAFTRYAIYAFIGLAEVFILFLLSLKVEHRVRTRDQAPEWR